MQVVGCGLRAEPWAYPAAPHSTAPGPKFRPDVRRSWHARNMSHRVCRLTSHRRSAQAHRRVQRHRRGHRRVCGVVCYTFVQIATVATREKWSRGRQWCLSTSGACARHGPRFRRSSVQIKNQKSRVLIRSSFCTLARQPPARYKKEHEQSGIASPCTLVAGGDAKTHFEGGLGQSATRVSVRTRPPQSATCTVPPVPVRQSSISARDPSVSITATTAT